MPIGRCCPLWRYPFTLFLEADELCEDHLYQKGELCKDHLYQKEYWEKLIWTTWSPLEDLQVDIYAGLRVSDQQTKHTFNCCTGRRNRQVLTWHDYNTRKPSLSDFPPPVHPVSSKNIDSEGNDDFWCRRMWWNDESRNMMSKRTHTIRDDVMTMISHLFTTSKLSTEWGGSPCNNTQKHAHPHLFVNQELRTWQSCSWHDPWISSVYGQEKH